MATIQLSPAIPNNIVELTINDREELQDAYERGDLIILKGVRIEADFEFLSSIRVPAPDNKRKKYFLTHPSQYAMDRNRDDVWQYFRNRVFPDDPLGFARFQDEVQRVNTQILEIGEQAFSCYPKRCCPLTWKFQAVKGENLHIDNIDGCDRAARLRVFINLSTSQRVWGLGGHLRSYADAHFESADLRRHAGAAYRFNQTLSLAAFGRSIDDCSDRYPRHIVRFAPGEVWFVNSTVVAHQVLSGDLLAIGSFVFPYRAYKHREQALPSIVSDICRDRMNPFAFAATAARNRIMRILKRERN
jgi:hypothetical protein